MASYFCLSGYGTNPANAYQSAVMAYMNTINGTLVDDVEAFKQKIEYTIKSVHTDYRRCAELKPTWYNANHGECGPPIWCISLAGSNFRVQCTLYPVLHREAKP